MFKLANAIADLFSNDTERSLYKHAASRFRIPYWDWSIPAPAGETHFPDVFWSPVISQYGPNGIQNIRNPLFSYVFHPLDENAFIWDPVRPVASEPDIAYFANWSQLKRWNETKRAPDTAASTTAPPSENYQVSAALLSKLPEIQQRLYILFSSYHDFNAFSNKAWSASQHLATLDSIESVHDIIHMYGGLKGHMTYVPLSSFDPLFFLHHTMTDRLIAMWQVLNPNAWIAPMAAGETSYTAVKGTIQTSTTPLEPFYATEDGMFWTSDMARNLEVFGYTYADTSPHVGDKDAVRQSLVGKINSWYGKSSPAGIRAKESDRQQALWRTGSSGSRLTASNKFQPNIKLTAEDPQVDKILHNNTYMEWLANVQVNVEALDGVYGVHFFIGSTPSDEKDWISAPNHVGSVSIFAMNRMTGSQSKISGSVPLTTALMKLVAKEKLSCLSREAVVPFLQQHLEIRVLGSNDTLIRLERVDGLHITITSAEVRVPETETSFPIWGDVVTEWEAWRG